MAANPANTRQGISVPKHLVRHQVCVVLFVVLALFLSMGSALAQQSVLQQAEALLNAKQYGSALFLLSPYEKELAGNLTYDYLYGLAFLETGNTGRAIFALRRAVGGDPDFAAARMELARAYYQESAYGDAERELLILQKQNPPPAARRVIEEYLANIQSRTPDRSRRVSLYVESGAGYDSNANVSTDLSNFLGFIIDSASRETDSSYFEILGGGGLTTPVSEGVVFDLGADLGHRNYPDASFVDTTVGRFRSGFRRVSEGKTQALGLRAYRLAIDGDLNSYGGQIDASWEQTIAPFTRASLFGRFGIIRYDDELEVKDVDQFLGGATIAHAFGNQRRGIVGGAVLIGRDEATESASRFSRDIYGFRVYAGWSFNRAVRIQGTASLLESRYDDIFFEQMFSNEREDTLTELALDLSWRITPNWGLHHKIAYYDNDTDVSIYDYDRFVSGISLQRRWD